MSKIYRIGVIGFAHMHINHLIERFAAHPQAELVACADTPALVPELRGGPLYPRLESAPCVGRLGRAKVV